MIPNSLKFLSIIVLAAAVTVQASYGQSNAWRGIVPLLSTRADVEKLLGKSEKGIYYGESRYLKGKEEITVNYTLERCDRGWNVPKDTVISVRIPAPDTEVNKSSAELNLVKDRFFISGDDAMFGTWTDPEAGIQYYFRRMSEILEQITLIPARSDNQRRCDGFPPYVPEAQYYPYQKRPFYDPKAGKDGGMDYLITASLYSTLISARDSKGEYKPFVLVYFDRTRPYSFYRKRLAEFRMKSAKFVKIAAQDVGIIEAGMDHQNRIIFYLVPAELKPPAPAPMLPSPLFMRKGKRLKN